MSLRSRILLHMCSTLEDLLLCAMGRTAAPQSGQPNCGRPPRPWDGREPRSDGERDPRRASRESRLQSCRLAPNRTGRTLPGLRGKFPSLHLHLRRLWHACLRRLPTQSAMKESDMCSWRMDWTEDYVVEPDRCAGLVWVCIVHHIC